MMWSNFFIQEEERRRADAVRRRAQRPGLARERRGPIKLALLLAGMGTALAVLAVGTEFWVELGTKRANRGEHGARSPLAKCEARPCWGDVPRSNSGPSRIQGEEANCSYFRFFTTGENNRILQRTTKKGRSSQPSAVSWARTQAPREPQGMAPVERWAPFSYSLPAGLLLLVSLELFRQGVRELLARTGPGPAPWLGYEYSWSVACALAAAALLLLGGGSFLLLSLPSSTWGTCCHQHPDDRGAGGAGAT
uniref:Voltage-dependent calcium channel gamma-6 subunit n=1 Tax=Sarcophilus harrisii TaxID=9305 RepID=G3W3R6_SARHA